MLNLDSAFLAAKCKNNSVREKKLRRLSFFTVIFSKKRKKS